MKYSIKLGKFNRSYAESVLLGFACIPLAGLITIGIAFAVIAIALLPIVGPILGLLGMVRLEKK
jgi:hypothetical protein